MRIDNSQNLAAVTNLLEQANQKSGPRFYVVIDPKTEVIGLSTDRKKASSLKQVARVLNQFVEDAKKDGPYLPRKKFLTNLSAFIKNTQGNEPETFLQRVTAKVSSVFRKVKDLLSGSHWSTLNKNQGELDSVLIAKIAPEAKIDPKVKIAPDTKSTEERSYGKRMREVDVIPTNAAGDIDDSVPRGDQGRLEKDPNTRATVGSRSTTFKSAEQPYDKFLMEEKNKEFDIIENKGGLLQSLKGLEKVSDKRLQSTFKHLFTAACDDSYKAARRKLNEEVLTHSKASKIIKVQSYQHEHVISMFIDSVDELRSNVESKKITPELAAEQFTLYIKNKLVANNRQTLVFDKEAFKDAIGSYYIKDGVGKPGKWIPLVEKPNGELVPAPALQVMLDSYNSDTWIDELDAKEDVTNPKVLSYEVMDEETLGEANQALLSVIDTDIFKEALLKHFLYVSNNQSAE